MVKPPKCPHAGEPVANELAALDIGATVVLFDYLARLERFCQQIERLRLND